MQVFKKFNNVKNITKIALRSLGRHKVKTALTSLMITVSVAVYIFMESWISGMSVESMRNIVNYETGAAKLQTLLYFEKHEDMPSYENFKDWEDYAAVLDEAGYNAAPRYVFSGTIYSPQGSAPIIVNAVEPAAEARTLVYTEYVDLGRYIKPGEAAIALGSMTAEKIKVGVPTRPYEQELEEIIAGLSADDAAFVRGCYRRMEANIQFMETAEYAEERSQGRMILGHDLSRPDLDRLWALFDAGGRNDVRISTVIDYKMAPEMIRADKWEAELLPSLRIEDKPLVEGAYLYDELTESFLLDTDDDAVLDAVLAAMIRADFQGAVRHVNQVIDAKVVGTINSPDPYTNYNIAFMPMDALQDESGMMLEGAVTEILIRDKLLGAADMTGDSEGPEEIRAMLEVGLADNGKTLPAELGVFAWSDYMEDTLNYMEMENGATKIFSIILFFLAVIGISNTMLLAILERGKEIGMMRALGMTDGEMLFCYLCEACFIGLIGSVLGVILGCLINYPMVEYGVDFSEMLEQMGGDMGYRISGNFRSMWDIPAVISAGLAGVILSSLMAFLPTRRALKLEITENLRFE